MIIEKNQSKISNSKAITNLLSLDYDGGIKKNAIYMKIRIIFFKHI